MTVYALSVSALLTTFESDVDSTDIWPAYRRVADACSVCGQRLLFRSTSMRSVKSTGSGRSERKENMSERSQSEISSYLALSEQFFSCALILFRLSGDCQNQATVICNISSLLRFRSLSSDYCASPLPTASGDPTSEGGLFLHPELIIAKSHVCDSPSALLKHAIALCESAFTLLEQRSEIFPLKRSSSAPLKNESVWDSVTYELGCVHLSLGRPDESLNVKSVTT